MKRMVIVHPFFFAIYAVLAVYANNANEMPVQWVPRPLLVLLILIAISFFALQKKLVDAQRAGLVTTLTLFWFFFGHMQRFLGERGAFWNTSLGTLLALLLWTVPLALLSSGWVWNRITNRNFVTNFLNLTSLIVVLLPGFITGRSIIETAWWSSVQAEKRSKDLSTSLSQNTYRPDIYLIILDGYGRQDVFRELYGIDNGEFIDYLQQKGFYVAAQSSPNYPMTWFSLSSMLNMKYLDEYTTALRNTKAHGPVYDLLQHSDIRWLLQANGYRFVALPSAALFTQIRDADIYYNMTGSDLNEFEGLLLSSTVANLAINSLDLDVPIPSYALQRRYILYSMQTLKAMPQIDGPKFVFAHIMAPHPPFVLDSSGNPLKPNRPYNMGDTSGFAGTSEEYKAGYVGEVRFLSQAMMGVIDAILEQSKEPPIIIVQGDHGPGNYIDLSQPTNTCLKERYSILNAYYFPDRDYSALYSSITPVNSFRVVLDQYFGAHLPLLDDRNYYSSWEAPYEFTDVTDQVPSCEIPKE